ncbi:BPSS1780 family membrane protein [Aquabacterium humicola]|uniref:BPSS1780 family membrane protein n=1 Tax=Aquabacterium humicola TaxID=3237377 RepID=UPI00254391C1|nr:BPSS1780 family membrane protein [Rubrivivax pictus]
MDDAFKGSIDARSVDAGRGINWWTDAWAMFTKHAGMWIVLSLILLLIFFVLAFIPFLGGIAAALLAPILVGGFMITARKAEAGVAPQPADLFVAFKTHAQPLAIIGALLLAAVVVFGLLMSVLGVGATFGFGMSGAHRSAGGMFAAMGAGLVFILLCIAFAFVLSMAVWFAPALVVFHELSPIDAIKTSFAASLKNFVPFILWGVVYLVASIVASIPAGLGWIVLAPVALLTAYVAYKDLFGGT